jgi:AcrR family transcriptional regulator
MATPATASRPMRADARRNRAALVAAARAEFAERAHEAAIEDIAKRAGVGVGTLYRHFPRRIDLVEAVYLEEIETLAESAATAAADADPFAGLSTWMQAYARYAMNKRNLLKELQEAFERDPGLRLQLRERLVASADKALAPAQAAGVVRADLSGDDLIRLVGGVCMSATATPDQNERLLDVILAGLRA